MSLLTHRSERSFASPRWQVPTLSTARWALIKRVCARILAVLFMMGMLAGIIAVKTIVFLPHVRG